MKQFIAPNYTFTPGISGVGTIDLFGISNFNKKFLVAIINQTTGELIYSTGSTTKGYISVVGNVLTLASNTSTHNSSDSLQIIYETSTLNDSVVSLDSKASILNDSLFLLRRIFQILKPLSIITGGGSNRLSVDVATVAAVTGVGTVTTVATVTAVTTIGSVTNQANMGGVPAFDLIKAMSRTAYNSGIRSKLT